MHMLHGICAYLAASEGFGVLWFEQSYVALAGQGAPVRFQFKCDPLLHRALPHTGIVLYIILCCIRLAPSKYKSQARICQIVLIYIFLLVSSAELKMNKSGGGGH